MLYVGSLHTRLLSTPVPPPLLPYAAKQQPCYHASPPPHNLLSPLRHTSRLSRAGPVISTSQVPPLIVPGIPASLPPPPLSPTYGRIVRATKRQRRTCIMRSPAQRLRLSSRNRSVSPQSHPGFLFWITRIICRHSLHNSLPILHATFHHRLVFLEWKISRCHPGKPESGLDMLERRFLAEVETRKLGVNDKESKKKRADIRNLNLRKRRTCTELYALPIDEGEG